MRTTNSLWVNGAFVIGGIVLGIIIIGLFLAFTTHLDGKIRESLIENDNTTTILVLGDEYSAPESSDWVRLLEKKPSYTIVNKARRGTTTKEMSENLPGYIILYEPDIIVVMAGHDDKPIIKKDLEIVEFRQLIKENLRGNHSGLLNKVVNGLIIFNQYNLANDITILTYPSVAIDIVYNHYIETHRYTLAKRILTRLPDGEDKNKRLINYYLTINDADSCTRVSPVPIDAKIYNSLGWCYVFLANYTQAEYYFLHAVNLSTDNSEYHASLAALYDTVINSTNKALYHYEKATKNKNTPPFVAGNFAWLLHDMNEYAKRDSVLSLATPPPKDSTFINYNKLVDIATSQKIKVIAVQYPIRDISNLKNILHNRSDVTYVENKHNFLARLENKSYNTLFKDRSAPEFGHPTIKGGELIASSVSLAILSQ